MSGGLLLETPLWLLVTVPAVALTVWAVRSSRVRISRTRHRAAATLRVLTILALALAMAGLTAWRPEDELTLVFAVDGSRSVGREGRERIETVLRDAEAEIGDGDQTGVIAFGREAMVDSLPRPAWRSGEILARPHDGGSDPSAALRLARGLFPPGHEGRLVLLTDGIETTGSIEDAVAASDPNLDLVWFPLPASESPEILLDQVAAPDRVLEGEPLRVRVVARTTHSTEATLRLFRGRTPVAASRVRLEPNRPNVFSFEEVAPDAGGALVYRARIETDADGSVENNAGAALVRVEGQPRVLLLAGSPADSAPLAAALRAAELDVTTGGAGRLPTDLIGLSSWDALILVDLPATAFAPQQLDLVKIWTETMGGGLTMIGGPESYGPGGWWDTPVEDVLPIDMEVRDRSYFPSLGLVVAIDKSGSMGGMSGASKIDLAKAAAVQVTDLLTAQDRIGVVAFDSAAKWVVEMTPGDQAGEVANEIGTLRAGGGTDAYPAMQEAQEVLSSTDVRIKHLILLTDGQLAGRDHEGLAATMKRDEITVTTIAVGSDADVYTLDRIAQRGGGRFYRAENVALLPRIFLREAFHVARSWVVEEPFQATVVGNHPALAGLDLGAAPGLGGYVATSDKPAAEPILRSHNDDPILTTWRTGLGKSVAFTSDAGRRWAGDWTSWDGYEPFWARLIRWTLRSESPGRLRAAAVAKDGRIHVSADVFDADGGFVNGEPVRAAIAAPDGQRHEVQLEQTAPGRYEASIPAGQPGPYLAAVLSGTDDDGFGATAAAVHPYADEFRSLTRAPTAFERLVESGRMRRADTVEDLYQRKGTGGIVRWPLAPPLLGLAALLLVLEVAVRRLRLPDFAAKLAALRGHREVHARSEDARLAALRAARSRADERMRTPEPSEPAPESAPRPPAPAPRPEAKAKESRPEPPKPPQPIGNQPAGYTSRLLAAKKRKRNQS